ncbi:MAG: membrane protein insertion efficiency factor YidD [Candidatus Levybacteria bacterium]|nr:membrane protein insertion efficiency factor YidD [Candidatus Levybacteria bacterium]
MKTAINLLASTYQAFISPILCQIAGTNNVCRFSPTCSDYARISITKKGLIYGGFLSIIRLLKCQPFYRGV